MKRKTIAQLEEALATSLEIRNHVEKRNSVLEQDLKVAGQKNAELHEQVRWFKMQNQHLIDAIAKLAQR